MIGAKRKTSRVVMTTAAAKCTAQMRPSSHTAALTPYHQGLTGSQPTPMPAPLCGTTHGMYEHTETGQEQAS
jgi:hypothetical protein